MTWGAAWGALRPGRARRPERPGGRSGPRPLVSVVVAAYDVAGYLPECLDSLLAQDHDRLQIVVVDDGSRDATGAIADSYAAVDDRVRVVHTDNHGLGAARNEGLRHTEGEYIAFADADDVVPSTAYATLVRSLRRSGADLATGSVQRWERESLAEPRWMRRLHNPGRHGIDVTAHPEILGDVFAWNKLYRRSSWDTAELSWPAGVRYEDQPTTTAAYLAASGSGGRGFDVLPEVVYHWRIRHDGSSITQQRSTVADLADRLATKQMSLAAVSAYVDGGGSREVREMFLDRVLAGDMHRYFAEIPGCSDEWWDLLADGTHALWGGRSLVHSGLLPVDRLVGWLVEQARREDAAAVVSYVAGLTGPVRRVSDRYGERLDVPVIDQTTVDPAALAVRLGE